MEYLIGVWIGIISCSVIGRLINQSDSPPPEILEENEFITIEQTASWAREFLSSPKSRSISYLEVLSDENPDFRTNRKLPSTLPSSRQNSRKYEFLEELDFNSLAKVKKENLEWMLKNIFNYPRSYTTNETAMNIAKKYIADSFQYTSGISTTIQHFKPTQFLNIYEYGEIPVGSNIIGLIKGSLWGSNEDSILVVGAHWDTVNFSPGTDDNGSGVAAMLEAARAIAQSGLKPIYSILFVAFDLEETGSQGSLAFIKDYLMKVLRGSEYGKEIKTNKFQGAFIMDTIMNFNNSPHSQTFPTDWSLVLPDLYDEVANENYMGNFLSLIYRKNVESRMALAFSYHWSRLAQSKYKLKKFPLSLGAQLPQMEILADHLNFLRSDHARFWYMNDTEVPMSLNAVLLTDTGPYRGKMRECYHTFCDSPTVSLYENEENLEFLTKATQALTNTLLDMSGAGKEESKSTNSETEQIRRWSSLSSSSSDKLRSFF